MEWLVWWCVTQRRIVSGRGLSVRFEFAVPKFLWRLLIFQIASFEILLNNLSNCQLGFAVCCQTLVVGLVAISPGCFHCIHSFEIANFRLSSIGENPNYALIALVYCSYLGSYFLFAWIANSNIFESCHFSKIIIFNIKTILIGFSPILFIIVDSKGNIEDASPISLMFADFFFLFAAPVFPFFLIFLIIILVIVKKNQNKVKSKENVTNEYLEQETSAIKY